MPKNRWLGAVLFLVLISSSSMAGVKRPTQEEYQTQDGQWIAWLSRRPRGHSVEWAIRSKDGRNEVRFKLTATPGDPEELDSPDGEAVGAQQYLQERPCWVALAVSFDQRYVRFKQTGCGHGLGEELFFLASPK